MGNRRQRRGLPSEPLFRRLDRAAAALNPFLALITVGLIIMNVIVAFSLVLPTRVSGGPPALFNAEAAATVQTTALAGN